MPTSYGLVLVIFGLLGCATSFTPEESSASFSKIRQSIPIEPGDDARLEQLFIRGLTKALIDDHAQAIYLFEQAIQIDATKPAFHIALAESHAAIDELDSAVYYASTAVQLDGENRTYTTTLFDLLKRVNEADRAITLLQGWIDTHPYDVEARLMIADLLADLGRPKDALSEYDKVLASGGDPLRLGYRMLPVFNGLGQMQQMRITLLRMLEIDSSNNELRNLLSEVYIELDSTNAAIELLQRTIQDDPSNIAAATSLSNLYRESSRESEAHALVAETSFGTNAPEDRLRIATGLYSKSSNDPASGELAEQILTELVADGLHLADAYYMLGDLRMRRFEFAGAAPVLLDAAQLEPRRVNAWLKSAQAFLSAGSPERALEVVREATILFPGESALFEVGAIASLELGDAKSAMNLVKDALNALDGDTPVGVRTGLMQLQSRIYRRLGKIGMAEKKLREILAIAPQNAGVRYRLGMSLVSKNDQLDEARELIAEGLDLPVGRSLLLDAMGWIEHLSGNNQRAQSLLLESIALDETQAQAHQHLSEVYASLSDTVNAEKHRQLAISLNSDNDLSTSPGNIHSNWNENWGTREGREY